MTTIQYMQLRYSETAYDSMIKLQSKFQQNLSRTKYVACGSFESEFLLPIKYEYQKDYP